MAVTEGAVTLGRAAPSTVILAEDRGLSRRHATVRVEAGRVWLTDEGSTNGSFVNGEPVPPGGVQLCDGDRIRIGHSTDVTAAIERAATPPHAPRPEPKPADVPPAPAAPAAPPQSIPLKVVVPAVLAALLLLCAVGFGLYALTRPPERAAAGRANPDDVGGAPTSPARGDAGGAEPIVVPDVLEAPPAPAEVSVLSSAPLPQPPPDEGEPPPAQRKLYREMGEAEQVEFVKRRAQHVAMMMGRRPYAFTPEALKHIKFWLDAFARRVGNKKTGLWAGDTIFIVERGTQNAPHIIRAFKEHNVPVVLGLYIPFIETEYTNIASNNAAGAAGLFQFLGPTAEHYGVPSSERTHVPLMAGAAARYFRDNILSFGDDPMSVALSIAGYNRAPESVKRDLRNVLSAPNNEDKERSFWTLIANQGKLDEYFQRENVNYVPRFFAAAILGETPWAFGIQLRPLSTYTALPPGQ